MTALHLQLAAELESMAGVADAKGKITGPALREIAAHFREHGAIEPAAELREAFARVCEMAADVDRGGAEAVTGWVWG